MKKRDVIIYAGVGSVSWDTEANNLIATLKKKGYNVLSIILVNGLDCPKIEYLDKKDCVHKWSEIKREDDDDNIVVFYYQRCEKCGIIRKIKK